MTGPTTSAKTILAAAATLAFTVAFFPVIGADLRDPVTYPVAFVPLVLTCALLSAFAALVFGALAIGAGKRWRRIAVLIMVGLATSAWVKLNFLVWGYGSIDGSVPDWDAFQLQGRIDILFGIGVVILFSFANRWISRKVTAICCFLTLAQILNLFWLSPAFSDRSFSDIFLKDTVQIAEKTEELLSTKSNVILIILDTFPSDVFSELVSRDPDLARQFGGFDFFTDTISAFPVTNLSIPAVLTGFEFRNQVPYSKYLYQAYSSPKSLMKNLLDEGYFVELDRWGLATPIPYQSGLASNITNHFWPDWKTAANLQLFALYRAAPQFLKQRLFGLVTHAELNVQGIADNNLKFIRDLSRLPARLTDQPVAKIIHLKGPHLPLQRYERYGFDYFAAARASEDSVEIKPTRANFLAVASQSIGSIAAFIKRLQEAGVYENTTLIVFGDHGAGLQGQSFVKPPDWQLASGEEVVSSPMRAAALPLLLAKQAGKQGPLETNQTPVRLTDINCTVRRLLAAHSNEDCISLFDAKTSPNARTFYATNIKFDSLGYIPAFREFEITGPAWKIGSWRTSLQEFMPRNVVHHPTPYNVGDTITFGAEGNAVDYKGIGWNDPSAGFTWTLGRETDLTVPLQDHSAEPLMLDAKLAPFTVAGKLDSQTVQVYANGQKVTQWNADGVGLYRAAIPARLAASGRIDLRLALPDATSPAALGINKDSAQLGLQVQSITFEKSGYVIGDAINFGRQGNADRYQSGGWADPGDGFTWTVGQRASLALPLKSVSANRLLLEAKLIPLLVPGKLDRQKIVVRANGEVIAEWQVSDAGTFKAVIPMRLAASGVVDLEFELPDARSTKQLGIDDNDARLGVQMQSITLRDFSYRSGEVISFDKSGSAAHYQLNGWDQPNDGFTWTLGSQASLILPIDDVSIPWIVEASLAPFLVPGKVERQTVIVFANNEKLTEWNVTAGGQFKAALPSRLTASGEVTLRFDLPDAESPADLGIGTESARYGVQMQSVRLFKAGYKPGSRILFNRGGDAVNFQSTGWGQPSDGFTWTVGSQATLAIPMLDYSAGAMMLEAELTPLVVSGRLDRQTINVFANGEKLAEWYATATGRYKAAIPSRLVASGKVDLRFDLPDATSLASLGINNDLAQLGLQMNSITMRDVSYHLGDLIKFGRGGQAATFQSGGWGEPNDGFSWTIGAQASLAIPFDSAPTGSLKLRMALVPFVVAGKRDFQTVRIYADGQKVGEWTVYEAGEFEASIPSRIVKRGSIDIRLEFPDATSPAALGLNSDTARFGVQVQSFALGR